MTAGVQLLHGLEGEAALDALAAAVTSSATDPFLMVPVCVPDAGTQRWASQGLARRLGVAAGMELTSLPAWLRTLREDLSGVGRDADPWRPDRLAWPLLEVLDQAHGEPWARVLTAHLPAPGEGSLPGRRMHTARRLAHLLRRYCRDAPDLVEAWADGADVGPDGDELGPAERWQPELWRRLLQRVEAPSPLEQQELAIEALEGTTLPALVVLDPPWLPELDAQLLSAVSERTVIRAITLGGHRDRDHRLVARLGRHEQGALAQWQALGTTVREAPVEPPRADSVLHALQSAVRGAPPSAPVVPDESVEWHLSHGPDRQVEVLRDALLRAFDADPTLEPRQAVVLCPDLATFAPHLVAAFNVVPREHANPAHALRVRIADTSLLDLNPVLGTISLLLDLASSRAVSTQLVDLCAHPPVARAFAFREEDLKRIPQLVERSGIRWGVDAAQRAAFGLGDIRQNTWVSGLDRILAGIALTDDALTPLGSTVLPLDDVGSNDVDLAGRLAELVTRVRRLLIAFAESRPVAGWVELFRQVVDGLTDTSFEDSWQTSHAHAVLADLADGAPAEGTPLGVGDVRVLLADLLRGRPPRASHGNGSLIVCQPGQLPHVPHRLVALLGFDAHTFPRGSAVDGDDLLALLPASRDRDARSRDRGLLLDAVLAAGEKLVVVHEGRDPRSNEDKPVPVTLAELHGALDDVTAAPLERRQHRLQPFAPEEFRGEQPSYDEVALDGARALVGDRLDPPPTFPTEPPLPELELDTLTLKDLSDFLAHPVRAFLRRRAGISFEAEEVDTADEEIPLTLEALAAWGVGDRMLTLGRQGAALDDVVRAEWLRGDVPPRALGADPLVRIRRSVEPLLEQARQAQTQPATEHDVAVTVDGLSLRGRVVTHGPTLVEVSYSRPAAKHILAGWVQLLALTVAEPGTAWRWQMIGKRTDARLRAVPADYAQKVLENLIQLYRLGMREPLPLPARVGLRQAQLADRTELSDRERDAEVAKEYHDRSTGWGDRDAMWALYWPDGAALLAERPRSGDHFRADASRLATLARRVWEPIFWAMEGQS